jgi:type I restriction enzyme S subunit
MSEATADFRDLDRLVRPVDAKLTLRKDPSKPYVGLEHLPSRGAHLLGCEAASHSVSTNSVFCAGDVLFGKLRPNLRKCVSVPFDGYCSTDILVLRAREDIHAGFAARVFQSEIVGAAAERTAIGTKMPRTSWTHLSGLKVFCPPFPEQERIAQIFDNLDTAIRQTEVMIAKLKALKQGLLHDLLTRGVDGNGELRPPHLEAPHLYTMSVLGWIPKAWGSIEFGRLSPEPRLGIMSRGASLDHENTFLLKMGNLLSENELCLKEVELICSKKIRNVNDYLLQDGDLLFNTRNTPELVGKTCSWNEIPGKYVFDNNILRVRVAQGQGNGHFYAHYLGSSLGRRRLLQLATGTTSVAAIYWKELKNLYLPFPLPDEQHEILKRLSATDAERLAEEASVGALRALKSGLMDDLLTGRVRVPPEVMNTGQSVLKDVA